MARTLQLERINPDISAEEFFSKYVSNRKPVVLTGLIDDPAFKGRKWTDLTYLSKKAGAVEVMVEPIHPTANQYGTDVERVPTSFGEFLKSLRSGKGPHPYLTTQYSDDEPDAETVFPPPTNALRDEFPTVPRIMGNLFLQQVNLWIGKSKEGSSSGLHHDFHDNLYCLLQGRKRFVLFPPSEVKNLYPYGTLDTLHSNGLIAYKDIPVRGDGLSRRAACKARVRTLEQKMDVLRATGKGKGKGKAHSKEMKALMNAHDEALDELAMHALEEQDGDGEIDDFDALMSGLDDVDAELAGPSNASQSSQEGYDEEEEWKGIGHSDSGSDGNDAGEDDDDDDGDSSASEDIEDGSDEDGTPEPSEPSSFSRIPTAHLHQFLDIPTTATLPPDFSPSDYANLHQATAPYVVELSAGEMLYLPASWWHEVTSTSAAAPNGLPGDVHMAFNYWFYPPDAPETFSAPYKDSLVWGYLREKETAETGARSAEKVTTGKGKRAGEKGVEGSVSKKARR